MKLTALLLVLVTLTLTNAEQQIDVDEQKLDISLFGYTWPTLTGDALGWAWGGWAAGFVLGGTSQLTSNMPWNSCLQDISMIVVDAYSIYVYLYRQIQTGEAQFAVYASSYSLDLVGKVVNVRCGDNEVSLEDALFSGDPNALNYTDIDTAINQINQQANFTDQQGPDIVNNGGSASVVTDPNDPWAYKKFLAKPQRKEKPGKIHRLSQVNYNPFDPFGYSQPSNTASQTGTVIDTSVQSFAGVGVNTGTNCTGAPSDPISCMDADGDGMIDSDYILNTFNTTLSSGSFDMDQFQQIMGTIVFFTQMLGTIFDLTSINSLWIAQLYIDSGLYSGKALIGMVFNGMKLVKVAIDGSLPTV